MEIFVGHSKIEEDLVESLLNERLHQGLLFFGPSGIGKKQLVFRLLQKALCKDFCGKCSKCSAIEERQGDLIHVLEHEDKKNITVNQVREVHRFFELKSQWPFRFVLVNDAHRLSMAAANSLLKILEEPPGNAHFFLVTDRLHSLPATIRSRCQLVRFSSLGHSEMEKIPAVNKASLPWSSGQVEKAIYLSSQEGSEHHSEALQILQKLVTSKAVVWKSEYPNFFSTGSWATKTFHFLLGALQLKLRGAELRELDFLPTDERSLLGAVRVLEKVQRDWAQFIDKNLLLENLCYDFEKIFTEKSLYLWSSPRPI